MTFISAENLKSKSTVNFLILLMQYSWKLLKKLLILAKAEFENVITIIMTVVAATKNSDSNFDA